MVIGSIHFITYRFADVRERVLELTASLMMSTLIVQ